MKVFKTICLAFLCGGFFSAHAASLQDMAGKWKEIGWRCEEAMFIHARESASDKFITIRANGFYQHQVNLNDGGKCRSVSSEGELIVQFDRGDRLNVLPSPHSQVDCNAGGSTLVDDFTFNGDFDIRIERRMIRDVLVLSGDPNYTGDCRNPAVERIYVRVP